MPTQNAPQRSSYEDGSQPSYASGPRYAPAPLPHSAMAVTALVLGIIALLTSFIPIVNNASFFIALLGAVFALVGVIATFRGTRRGKGMAIASLVVNVVAIAVVLAVQSTLSAAVKTAMDDPSVKAATTAVVSAALTEATTSSSTAPDQLTDLAIGAPAVLANGMTVTVDAVQTGLVNYDGSAMSAVRVTCTNNGASDLSFNALDWKCQDDQGVLRTMGIYAGADASEADASMLSSGTLVPGGTISGTVYFDGNATKAMYYGSAFSNTLWASWTVA